MIFFIAADDFHEEKKEQYFKELVLHPPTDALVSCSTAIAVCAVSWLSRRPLPRYEAYTFGVGSKSPTHSQRGDDRDAEEYEGAELP